MTEATSNKDVALARYTSRKTCKGLYARFCYDTISICTLKDFNYQIASQISKFENCVTKLNFATVHNILVPFGKKITHVDPHDCGKKIRSLTKASVKLAGDHGDPSFEL